MGRVTFKPGNMLYPLPVVLVTVRDAEGRDNIFTVAWTGTVCTNPPMLYISVRPGRHSYKALKETGCFAVNLTSRNLARETDYCGVRSGRDEDKIKKTGLAVREAQKIDCLILEDSPVAIECRTRQVLDLGSHHMFLADVVNVSVDERYIDEKGSFHLEKADPIVYSHGAYHELGQALGTFGFSVRKKSPGKKGRMKPGKGRKKRL